MDSSQLAGSGLSEQMLKTLVVNENRIAALAHSVTVRQKDDTIEHIVVRARVFENFLKNG